MNLAALVIGKALRTIAPFADAVRPIALAKSGCDRPITRAQLVSAIPAGRSTLEIGPFNCPVTTGPNVRYFDVLDTECLVDRARSLGRDPSATPKIDYVSPTGDLGVIAEKFTSIVSCHAIEHQPDLIAHLSQIERLLEPGGRYYIIAPDRRYSFDNTVKPSDLTDVLAAQGRRVHTPEAVLAHRLETTHNDVGLHWLGIHGRPAPSQAVVTEAGEQAERAAAGEYVDVHAWILAPADFRSIINALHEDGLIGLRALSVYETPLGRLEYCAVLERPDLGRESA